MLCTSLVCHHRALRRQPEYCYTCPHAMFYGSGEDSNGTHWKWEFSPVHGPLFVDEENSPLENQPRHHSHPAWEPFTRWIRRFPRNQFNTKCWKCGRFTRRDLWTTKDPKVHVRPLCDTCFSKLNDLPF